MENLELSLKDIEKRMCALFDKMQSCKGRIEILNSELYEAKSDMDKAIKERDSLCALHKKLHDKIEAQKAAELQKASENEVLPKTIIGANDDEMFYEDFKTCF